MPNSGDVVDLDIGVPQGREAGFGRPAVVVTAQAILDLGPPVLQVVPLTTTIRGFASEVIVAPDMDNGLNHLSAAQAQHIRAIAVARITGVRGNVGSVVLGQIRSALSIVMDLVD